MRTPFKAAMFSAVLATGLLASMGQARVTRGFQTMWDGSQFIFGAPSALANVGGTLTTNTTSACTIADTNETDLWTYSLPANALNANGRGVRITAWGSTAATANTKTLSLYFGSTVLRTNALAASGLTWWFSAVVVRTGASAQLTLAEYRIGTQVINPALGTPAESTSGAIVIKVTGTNGTAAANDICFKGAVVETIK